MGNFSKVLGIRKIKEIIKEFGETTIEELKLSNLYLYNSKEKYSLIKGFNKTSVEIDFYIHKNKIKSSEVLYEDLKENVVDEVLIVMEKYKKKCEN